MKKLIILFTLVAVSFSADKWEYMMATNIHLIKDKITFFNATDSTYNVNWNEKDSNAKNVLYRGLNKMGADGWELVSIDDNDNLNEQALMTTLYFKRKIEGD